MARSKKLEYYDGILKGKYLSDSDCERLLKLKKLSEDNGCVEDLKHIIYNCSDSEVEEIKASKSASYIDKKLGKLRDYQTLGVAYMYFAKRLVLGDSVGLGKTVEVCGLINLLKEEYLKKGQEFRFLFLTDKTLLDQTRDEIIKFTGDYVTLLQGEKRYVDKFVIENDNDLQYSVVGSHSLINSVGFQEYIRVYRELYDCNPFDILFVDESSILGNTSTKTYDNALHLAKDIDRVIIMNATPFESNLRTFYAQLNFCDESLLPVKSTFERLYEQKTYYGSFPRFNGKYKNQAIFKEQVKFRYWASTRKGLGYSMIDCSAKLYVSPLSKMQKELLKRTSIPQMVYDCPSYFDDSIIVNKQTVPKLNDLIAILTTDLKDVDSVIVYTWHKESQSIIEEVLVTEGIPCEIMNGDTPLEERNAITRAFKLGDFKVLITNVQKGLNFSNCDNCIFYSYDPNPNKMVQLEGRMTREENIIGKHVYLLVSEGKEYKRFKEVVADRAKASDIFAGSDFSCVLNLLLNVEEVS